VTTDPTPGAGGPEQAGRQDNGLVAPAYVPLTDVDDAVGRHLLVALGRARIAAYLDTSPAEKPDHRRLYVAAEERADARTIVAAAVRALGDPTPDEPDRPDDPLAGIDTDAAFDQLVADWHVDTVAAVREAERQLRAEDAEWRARLEQPPIEEPVWLDDDHYVPPPPPPLPRLSAPTIGATLLLVISVLLLALGGGLGLDRNFTMLLGVGGVLVGAGILIMRLRDRPDDEDDDGAVI
jgi:hypothetical protein